MLTSRSVTSVADRHSVTGAKTLEVVSLHDSLKALADAMIPPSQFSLHLRAQTSSRRCLHIHTLPRHKVSSRDGRPCPPHRVSSPLPLLSLKSRAPGATIASSVTANSTILILGSVPALRNSPSTAADAVFARRGVQPTVTEWRGGRVEVEGYELEAMTCTSSSWARKGEGQLGSFCARRKRRRTWRTVTGTRMPSDQRQVMPCFRARTPVR